MKLCCAERMVNQMIGYPPGLFIFSLIVLTAQLHPDCGLYIDVIQTVLNMFTLHLAAVNTG